MVGELGPTPPDAGASAPVIREVYIPERPRRRGIGSYVAAGVIFAPAIVLKGVATSQALRAARSADEFQIFNGPAVLFGFSVLYNPLFATSIGLYGSARAKSGRVAAWDTVFGRKGERDTRPGLGWGLFAGGIALWGFTRLPALTNPCSSTCEVGIMEAGYYLSLPMTYGGLHFAAFSRGYRSNVPRYEVMRTWSITPTGGRTSLGLQLGGRF